MNEIDSVQCPKIILFTNEANNCSGSSSSTQTSLPQPHGHAQSRPGWDPEAQLLWRTDRSVLGGKDRNDRRAPRKPLATSADSFSAEQIHKRWVKGRWRQKRAEELPNKENLHACILYTPYIYIHTIPPIKNILTSPAGSEEGEEECQKPVGFTEKTS